jgi:hypothetical protein
MIFGLMAEYALETHWMDAAKQMSITRLLSELLHWITEFERLSTKKYMNVQPSHLLPVFRIWKGYDISC